MSSLNSYTKFGNFPRAAAIPFSRIENRGLPLYTTLMESLFDVLSRLVFAPGVSGAEDAVAREIEALLETAGLDVSRIEKDRLGNRFVRFGGGESPRRVLVAHMDEIGFRITSIGADGVCRVIATGGIDPQLYEGAQVEIHSKSGAIPAVFSPVSHHVTFRTGVFKDKRISVEDLMLDMGAKSLEEVTALGVRLLDSVTFPKRFRRLAGGFVEARSLDDRFGCAALVMLAARLAEKPPPVSTVLAWAVQEEVGLRGARALASKYSPEEAIAIDSFTVGTGPRDNRQFDAVKPGGGAVLRALDSTTIVPDSVREAILDKAAALGVSLQYGYMPGGNDASMFEAGGARVFGFGVPVEFSHTAAERIHFGDLENLVELLAAWCASDIGL